MRAQGGRCDVGKKKVGARGTGKARKRHGGFARGTGVAKASQVMWGCAFSRELQDNWIPVSGANSPASRGYLQALWLGTALALRSS